MASFDMPRKQKIESNRIPSKSMSSMSYIHTPIRLGALVASLALATVILPGCTAPVSTVRLVDTSPAPSGPSTAERIRDALSREPSLSNYSLEISVAGNLVQLIGESKTAQDRLLIEQITRSVVPDFKVDNLLQVKRGVTDEEITTKVREELIKDGIPGAEQLEVTTSSHVVTVSGKQPSSHDIDRVLSLILNVSDVENVENKLTVAKPSDSIRPSDILSRSLRY